MPKLQERITATKRLSVIRKKREQNKKMIIMISFVVIAFCVVLGAQMIKKYNTLSDLAYLIPSFILDFTFNFSLIILYNFFNGLDRIFIVFHKMEAALSIIFEPINTSNIAMTPSVITIEKNLGRPKLYLR